MNLYVTIAFGYFQNENALLQYFYGIMEEKKSRDPKLSTNILIMELLTILNKNKLSLEARYSF
jgi:Asp-tRNA(Asn)/Glu-tRNA(Gln) amidotransferase B subunit